QGLAQAGVGQAEIIIDVVHRYLLPQAVLALAQRGNTPSDCRHMLPDGEVEALRERRVDLPAQRRQHLLDGRDRAKHDAVRDTDQAPAPHGLDHLRVEQAAAGASSAAWAWGLCLGVVGAAPSIHSASATP